LIGVIQIVPTIMVKSNIPTIASVKPYTPLELEGRDLYIREGCVGCHLKWLDLSARSSRTLWPNLKAGEFV
jgi:cytochrome c oxidase cbb3-type subunit I/II